MVGFGIYRALKALYEATQRGRIRCHAEKIAYKLGCHPQDVAAEFNGSLYRRYVSKTPLGYGLTREGRRAADE